MPEEIKVKVSSETSSVEQGLSRTSSSVRRLASDVEDANSRTVASYQGMQQKIGQSLLGISAVIGTGFAGAAKAGADVEKSLRAVNTMAKLSDQGFKQLTDSVFNLSNSMRGGGNAKELSDALLDIYGAGLDGAKAMATLTAANEAAGAGMVSVAKAADPITSAMLNYKIGAEGAQRVSDILFKTVDRGKITFEELAAGIGPVLGIASAFNVKLEEVGAAVALLTKNGVPASQAMTVIERAIIGVATPAPEAAKVMKSLGIEYGSAALQAKGLGGVLTDIIVKSGGSEEAIHKMIPSTEALQLALKLAKDKGADFRVELGEIGNAAGSARAALDEQLKGSAKQWDEFVKTAYNAAAKFGTDVLPIVNKGIEAVTSVAKKFEEASPATRKFAESATLLTGVLSGVTGGFILLSPAIASLPASLAVVRGAIALTMASFGPLSALMAGLTVTVGLLYTAWEKNFLGIQRITTEVVDQVSGMIKDLENNFQSIPKMFTAGAINDLRDKTERESWIKASANRGPDGGLAGLSGPNIKLTGSMVVPSSNPNLPQQIRFNQSARDLARQRAANASSVDPSLGALSGASLSEPFNSMQAMIDKQAEAAKGSAAIATEAAKKKAATEDELRQKMVETARKTVGESTVTIAKISKLGDASNQCANTMRLISERAGMSFGVDKNPFDKGRLAPGESVDRGHADSLFGNKVGKYKQNNPAMGDMVFFEKSGRPGVVGHVGMVSGNGNMIDASSSQQRVVERPINSTGQRVLGYISPNVYGKGSTATEDEFQTLRDELKRRREDFTRFVETDTERQIRDLYEAAQKAIDGTNNPAEQEKVFAVLSDKLAELKQAVDDPMAQLFDARKEFLQEILTSGLSDSADQFKFDRAMLGPKDNALPVLQARSSQLGGEIGAVQSVAGEIEAEKILRDLKLERKQIDQEIADLVTRRADDAAKTALDKFAFDQQMGQLDLEQKKLWLDTELQQFQGSEDMKRQLILERHQLETQLQTEQNAFADEVFQGFQQSLQGMLTQSLSSQANFGQSFQSMWKSVANSILAEITKMIVKALFLQKIMRSIFGFFGGGLGGLLGLCAGPGLSAAAAVADSIPTFHSGGALGGVLDGLRADELLVKAQNDEVILTGSQVDQMNRSGRGMSFSFGDINVHGSGGNVDPQMIANTITRQIEYRMQGV